MAVLPWIGGAIAFLAGMPQIGAAVLAVNLVNGAFGFWQEHKAEKADVYRHLGVQTVTPVPWAIHRMADLLCFSHLDTVISLGSGEVDIAETEIPPLLVGRTVPELRVPGEIRVVAITREGRTFLPSDGTLFCKGDRLHIALLGASSDRLRTLLGLG
jgi:trk system potassium uptake protein TrkA